MSPRIHGKKEIHPPSHDSSKVGWKRGRGMTKFSEVLDQIENLKENARERIFKNEKNEDPASFLKIFAQAEESFRKAMELKGAIEAAWRRNRNPYK